MYEKVNPCHPDKVADRIGGALLDLAYSKKEDPKVALEILLGHGHCHIVNETDTHLAKKEVKAIVRRITGAKKIRVDYLEVAQDPHLSGNQAGGFRCGDNGVFRGMPVTKEQRRLTHIASEIYRNFPTDGKYILAGSKLIVCQSCAEERRLNAIVNAVHGLKNAHINPLGSWTGGPDVDTGAINRKLGSDMGDAVTGGGLCLSGDSEFISDDFKWHRMDEYKKGMKVGQWNNGILEFVDPIKYIYNEEDDFIYIHNGTKLAMKLTPYHQMLIKTSKNNLIKKDTGEIAKKLHDGIGNSGSIIHNFTYFKKARKSAFETEKDYRLQVAFCADGTILGGTHKKWNGRIRVKKQYKRERLRWLLEGKEYKETFDTEGYSIFWIKAPIKSKSLYECFKNERLDILLDEVFKWDGDERKRVFRTTHKEDADFVQFAIACSGKTATITSHDSRGYISVQHGKEYVGKSIQYSVNELLSTTTGLRMHKGTKIKVDYLSEKAPSYCFEVPSHNLVIRCDDKIFVTGNCGKDLSKADVSVNIYAHLRAQKLKEPVEIHCAIGDEEVDGLPFSKIVEVARAYIKRIGGFEKFAEWGLIRPDVV